MCKTITVAPSRRHLWPHVFSVALLAACTSTSQVAASTKPATVAQVPEAVSALAERLSHPAPAATAQAKSDLVGSYEAAYGPIIVPLATWDAAIRRALTCDAVNDSHCLESSLDVLDQLGGLDALPLDKLQEVSQFSVTPAMIKKRVSDARAKVAQSDSNFPPATTVTVAAASMVQSEPLPHPRIVASPAAAALAPAQADTSDNLTILAAIAFVLAGAGMTYGISSQVERNRAVRQSRERESEARIAHKMDKKAELESREKAQREQLEAIVSAAAAAVHVAPSALVMGADAPVGEQDSGDEDQLPDLVSTRQPEDPRFVAARRLLDALHRAERDVDPFLAHIGDIGADDSVAQSRRQVVIAWHEAVYKARYDLSEVFSRHGWDHDLPVTPAPRTVGDAMQRLMEHSALFSTLLQSQGKEGSAIFHWSKLLPGAALQLYWSCQTLRYANDFRTQPMPSVSYAPAPGITSALPQAANRPVTNQTQSSEKQNDFYKQALRHATTSAGRRAA